MFAVLVAAVLAASSWGFTADPGTRLAEGVSTEALSLDGTVWAWASTPHGMSVSTSTGGLLFAPAAGVSSPPGADAAIVPLAGGGWRMYTTSQEQSGKVIRSATSADLRTWTPDAGVRVELGPSRATGVPDAVVLPDGRVRLYYVVPGVGGESIDSSISSDGLAFTRESGHRLTGGYVDPAVVRLSDGSWLMATSTSPASKQRLYVAGSADGLVWARQATPLLDRSDANALDPTLLPLGGDRFRVYYSVAALGLQLSGPFHVESGVVERRAATPPAKKPAPAKKKKKPAKKPPRKKKKH